MKGITGTTVLTGLLGSPVKHSKSPLMHNKAFELLDLDYRYLCFEVDTTYKSGRKRTETIVSENEETMWKWYDKHHNKELVESSVIVDAWLQ